MPKHFLNMFFKLILERERERGERKRNIYVGEKHQLAASFTHPDQGSNPKSGHVP